MFDRISSRYDLDEPADLRVPGAALAAAPRAGDRASGRAMRRSTSRRGTGKVAADLHAPGRARSAGSLGRRPQPGDDRRRAAASTPAARPRVRRRGRARPADRGRAASTPPRSPSACATCPTTGAGSRRWPARCGPAAASCASRSPGRGAGSPGSCAGGSTGSCPSSAGSPARAPRTATSSGVRPGVPVARADRRDHGRGRPRRRPLAGPHRRHRDAPRGTVPRR